MGGALCATRFTYKTKTYKHIFGDIFVEEETLSVCFSYIQSLFHTKYVTNVHGFYIHTETTYYNYKVTPIKVIFA